MEPELRRDIRVCSLTFEIYKKDEGPPPTLCSPLGKGKEESLGPVSRPCYVAFGPAAPPSEPPWFHLPTVIKNFVIKNPLLGVR